MVSCFASRLVSIIQIFHHLCNILGSINRTISNLKSCLIEKIREKITAKDRPNQCSQPKFDVHSQGKNDILKKISGHSVFPSAHMYTDSSSPPNT